MIFESNPAQLNLHHQAEEPLTHIGLRMVFHESSSSKTIRHNHCPA
ncbi:unnamed protein product [Musa banksii]